MTDPAEAAAKRADLDGYGDPVYWSTTRDAMVAAAREMAQSVRDLIETCEELGEEIDIRELKELVYPKGEVIVTDPAVAAAKRALPDNTFDPRHDDYSTTALAAANEALNPIRDLVERCEGFGDELDIDDLKPLIYPKRELL